MSIILNGTTGITTPDVNSDSYTGALGVDASAPDNSLVVDSSGNLLVGKTSTDINTQGAELKENGTIFATSNDDKALDVNRLSSDGDIIKFRKDGGTVGSIGVRSSVYGYFEFGSIGTGIGGTSAHIWLPMVNGLRSDNTTDIGELSYRFDDIYATNGTIQTSDRNEKQDIEVLSEAEQRAAVAAKALLRKFRWKDSVAEKGDEARIHFGIIAQDLQAAFEAEGLDAGKYAMFIHSEWTDDETGEQRSRMGVRYSELLAFIIAAI